MLSQYLDRNTARAAGQDAGNRSMRAAGRANWNQDDWNAAAKASNDVLRALGYRVQDATQQVAA